MPLTSRASAFLALAIAAILSTHYPQPQEWHLAYLNVETAHQLSTGRGITIAIVDSGVDPSVGLQRATLEGASFLEGDNSKGKRDEFGHGTSLASLIAYGEPKSKPLGIAPDAKILPVRVLDATGNGNASNTAKGIEWATLNGADIINVSSTGGPSPEMRLAVQNALDKGIVVVASSGNKPGQNIIAFPAYIDGVVAVGATDKNGKIADISATGERQSLTAPGVELIKYSTSNGNQSGTGTSGSAAIVSGVAALVWSRYPELSAAEVVHRMTATAVDKGAPGRDPEYGFGIVDPVAALTADVPPLEPSAQPAPTSAASDPAHAPNTMGQIAVILIATIASLLAVALAITLLVFRLRSQNRRNRTELPDGDDT